MTKEQLLKVMREIKHSFDELDMETAMRMIYDCGLLTIVDNALEQTDADQIEEIDYDIIIVFYEQCVQSWRKSIAED